MPSPWLALTAGQLVGSSSPLTLLLLAVLASKGSLPRHSYIPTYFSLCSSFKAVNLEDEVLQSVSRGCAVGLEVLLPTLPSALQDPRTHLTAFNLAEDEEILKPLAEEPSVIEQFITIDLSLL